MKITELATIFDQELQISYNKDNEYWRCRFKSSETKEFEGSAILSSTSGYGKNPGDALSGYVEKLRGKILIFHAMNESKRKEIKIPTTLSLS